VVDGQIVVRPIMVVALTYDHRMLDGREAVTFLGEYAGEEGVRLSLMPLNSAGKGVLGGPAEDVTTLSGSRSRSLLISLTIDLVQKMLYSWHFARPSDRKILRVKSGWAMASRPRCARWSGTLFHILAEHCRRLVSYPGPCLDTKEGEASLTTWRAVMWRPCEGCGWGEPKARLRREVIVKSSEDVNVMPWPQDLASGVIGPGRGPATNLSHNQNRKQTCAAIAQLREGDIDRIFPSEHEITPTVSNKTEEGPPNRCLVFFSHSLPRPPQPSHTMLLVHKPLPISSPTPAHFHRRLSSAPHVSVQPTRTPGLLSIIPKQQPHRPPQPQRSQQRMTPLKENQRHNRSPKPANLKAQPVGLQEVIKFSVVESDKPKSVKVQSKNPSPTSDKSSSGRNSQKRSPKDKTTAERYCIPHIPRPIRFWYSSDGTQGFFLDTSQATSSTSPPTISSSDFRPG